jgi:hypothetical protein
MVMSYHDNRTAKSLVCSGRETRWLGHVSLKTTYDDTNGSTKGLLYFVSTLSNGESEKNMNSCTGAGRGAKQVTAFMDLKS